MQNNSKNIKKEFYTVKMEVLLPAEVEYKILAESPEEALSEALKIKNKFYHPPKINFLHLKPKTAKVFKFKDLFLQLIRRF